jgi:hypothetical protein
MTSSSRKYLLAIIVLLFSSSSIGADMRTVAYVRHEYHGDPERRNAELPVLVYDIPYFGACGIFPPRHVMNEFLLTGGGDGGMSPGASWQPFELSRGEYDELVQAVKLLDPQSLGDRARYTRVKFEFDSSFDHIETWESWLEAVCQKHRDAFLRKHRRAQ